MPGFFAQNDRHRNHVRMQASYDIAQTRKREKQIHVRRIRQVANDHA
jgi:hypothetical protein